MITRPRHLGLAANEAGHGHEIAANLLNQRINAGLPLLATYLGIGFEAFVEAAVVGFERAPPRAQKRPIAPIFIADKVSLAVSREKDGKLRPESPTPIRCN